jgi:hypothetical protein
MFENENVKNATQGIIAAIESMIIFDGSYNKDFVFGAIIFIAAYIPSSYAIMGYNVTNMNNEGLVEVAATMLLSALIITPIWGGGVFVNMMKGFFLNTSSYAVINELNVLVNNGGDNLKYNKFRAANAPTNINKVMLG